MTNFGSARLLMSLALATGLSACAKQVVEYSPVESASEIRVTQVGLVHDVRFTPGSTELSATEAQRLQAFVLRDQVGYGDRVVLPSPRGATAEATQLAQRQTDAVAAYLRRLGLTASRESSPGTLPRPANQVSVVVARAVVDAIADFPHMNASVGDDQLVVHRYIDLGIAVDLDYQGLLVPVVRDAETKRLRAISREINDLASRARSRRLSPDEITGGTFTISNNGSAGSVLTMPIINQPQVAILSTDAIVKKPVVVNVPGGGESIAIHPVGNLAMAWDHRAFDGAYAAGFLSRIKEILETRDWSSEV